MTQAYQPSLEALAKSIMQGQEIADGVKLEKISAVCMAFHRSNTVHGQKCPFDEAAARQNIFDRLVTNWF